MNTLVLIPDPKTVTPKGTKLLVERAPAESQAGVFAIPDEAKQKARYGTVLAVGPDVKPESGIAKGSTVVFGAFAGNTITFSIRHDDSVITLDEKDVLGFL